MLRIGYKLMSEEHGPEELVRNAKRAEQAGFDFAAFPIISFRGSRSRGIRRWLGRSWEQWQTRHSRIGLMTAVTCPIMRYHPAIIAQGAATLGLLSNNRFTLGLGAGERLNEHIVGAGWPGRAERHERLSEATDIIQGLLAGDLTNYRGHYFRLDHARLFDRPETKPAVAIAAGGVEAARLAGKRGMDLSRPSREPTSSKPSSLAEVRGPSMQRWRCLMQNKRRMRRRPLIIIFAGRLRAGP